MHDRMAKVDSLLLNLPASIGASILSSWITLRGVTKLDNACCNHATRNDYLAWTGGVTLTEEIQIKNDRCSEWFVRRGVQVRRINAEVFTSNGSLQHFDRFTLFFRACCSSLQSIQIFNNIDDSRDPVRPKLLRFVSMVNELCPRLTEIRMIGANFRNEALLAMTKDRPNLQKIVVQYCRFMDNAAFANVWTTCKKLEVFHVRMCEADVQLLCNIVAGCPLLKDLSYMECDNLGLVKAGLLNPSSHLRRLEFSKLDSDVIGQISDTCPSLESLAVHDAAGVTKEGWTKLLTSCVVLQELKVINCEHLDLSALLQLRGLRLLYIGACPAVTDAFVLSLAAANVGLAKLVAVDCSRVTYQVVHPLLASCPWVRNLYLSNTEESPTWGAHQLISEYVRRQHPHVQSVSLLL
jgi:hypothetical protein